MKRAPARRPRSLPRARSTAPGVYSFVAMETGFKTSYLLSLLLFDGYYLSGKIRLPPHDGDGAKIVCPPDTKMWYVARPWENAMAECESFVTTGFVQLSAESRQMHRIIRSAFGLVLGAALLVTSFTLGSTSAFAQFAGPSRWASPMAGPTSHSAPAVRQSRKSTASCS
jgi:hypothetical protein